MVISVIKKENDNDNSNTSTDTNNIADVYDNDKINRKV